MIKERELLNQKDSEQKDQDFSRNAFNNITSFAVGCATGLMVSFKLFDGLEEYSEIDTEKVAIEFRYRAGNGEQVIHTVTSENAEIAKKLGNDMLLREIEDKTSLIATEYVEKVVKENGLSNEDSYLLRLVINEFSEAIIEYISNASNEDNLNT